MAASTAAAAAAGAAAAAAAAASPAAADCRLLDGGARSKRVDQGRSLRVQSNASAAPSKA